MDAREQSKSLWKSVTGLVSGTVDLLGQRVVTSLEKARNPGLMDLNRISVVDNTDIANQESRYLERFSFLTDDSLKLMHKRDVIVSAIVARRTSQMAKFTRPAHKKNSMGFKICVREGLEEDLEQDAEVAAMVEDFILNTGSLEDREKDERMNFEEFIRRETEDLMVLDRVAIEKIPTGDGGLHSVCPIDASTVKYARRVNDNLTINLRDTYVPTLDSADEEKRVAAMEQRIGDASPDDVRFVQVLNQKIVAYYTHNDMVMRNFTPSNDVRLNGYSVGPLEKLVAIVTSHLFAEAHNRFFFTQGFSTRGILAIKGNVPQQQLDAFRRQWYSQISGAQNSFRTPIIGGENVEVNWIPLQMNNRDMEWDIWMNYLVKVICALYLIAPQEIGWDIGTSGTGMISGDSGKRNMVLLTESKDVGLDPILRFFENLINEEIMPYFGPEIAQRYYFKFVGLGVDNPDEETNRVIQQMNSFLKLDEARIQMGLEPIGPPLGELILNPVLVPFYQAMLGLDEGGGSTDSTKKGKKDQERDMRSSKKRQRQSKHKQK